MAILNVIISKNNSIETINILTTDDSIKQQVNFKWLVQDSDNIKNYLEATGKYLITKSNSCDDGLLVSFEMGSYISSYDVAIFMMIEQYVDGLNEAKIRITSIDKTTPIDSVTMMDVDNSQSIINRDNVIDNEINVTTHYDHFSKIINESSIDNANEDDDEDDVKKKKKSSKKSAKKSNSNKSKSKFSDINSSKVIDDKKLKKSIKRHDVILFDNKKGKKIMKKDREVFSDVLKTLYPGDKKYIKKFRKHALDRIMDNLMISKKEFEEIMDKKKHTKNTNGVKKYRKPRNSVNVGGYYIANPSFYDPSK